MFQKDLEICLNNFFVNKCCVLFEAYLFDYALVFYSMSLS